MHSGLSNNTENLMCHTLVALVLLTITTGAIAAPTATKVRQCPNRISSVAIVGPVDKWEAEIRYPLLLNDATISLGPPHEHADLRPDSVLNGAHYKNLTHMPDDHPRWLTCFYGQGNELVMATPLPLGIDECIIRKHSTQDNVVQVDVSCQMP